MFSRIQRGEREQSLLFLRGNVPGPIPNQILPFNSCRFPKTPQSTLSVLLRLDFQLWEGGLQLSLAGIGLCLRSAGRELSYDSNPSAGTVVSICHSISCSWYAIKVSLHGQRPNIFSFQSIYVERLRSVSVSNFSLGTTEFSESISVKVPCTLVGFGR